MTYRVLLAGGTGLVGSHLTALLAARRDIELTSLVRKARSPAERVTDFESLVADPLTAAGAGNVDVGISCLGTTIRKAGTQSAFYRVDHDYVVVVAQAARAKGARQFILVSSVGAGGRSFYLRVKGDAERAVAQLRFERLDIIRPGLIIGERQERRRFERIAQSIAPLLDPLLLGGLRRYSSVPADTIAMAISALIGRSGGGRHVHESPELIRLGNIA